MDSSNCVTNPDRVTPVLPRLLACCFLLASVDAGAGTLDYSMGYDVTYSDNINRVSDDEESEYIHRIGTDFAFEQVGSRLSATATGSLDYEEYANNTRSDRWAPILDAESRLVLRPKSLEWVFIDHARQVSVNSAAADSPNNTQTTNIFLTGPDLTFRMDAINSLVAQVRYGRYYFSNRTDDSDRYLGAFKWLRAGRTVTSSLNLDFSDVRFDDQNTSDFKKYDLYAAGEWLDARNITTIAMGATTVDRESGSDVDGFLFRLNLVRALSENTEAGISGHIETTDSGSFIPTTTTSRIDNSAGQIDSGDVVKTKRAGVTFRHTGLQWSQGFRGYAYQLDYKVDPTSRDVYGATLDIARLFSATMEATAFFDYSETDWTDLDRDDTDKSASLRITYSARPELRFFAGGGWYKRSSSDDVQRYTESRANIGLVYGFL